MSVRHIGAGIAAFLITTAAGVSFGESAPARKPVPVVRMTCADFLAFEDAVKPEVVYWAAIHDRGGRRLIDTVDVDATDRAVVAVTTKCRMDPDRSFWQTVNLETGHFADHALQHDTRLRVD